MRDLVLNARRDENKRTMLVKGFEPIIKKCIKIYVKDSGYFEDAMQEGYAAVLSCIRNYNIDSNYPFPAYVKRAVIYAIRDFSKRIKNDISLDEELNEDGGSLHDIIEGNINIEEDTIKCEDIVNLRKALNQLSEKQRKVIDEFFFKNITMMEMSKNRRCHYMAVAGLKNRAIERLRQEMNIGF